MKQEDKKSRGEASGSNRGNEGYKVPDGYFDTLPDRIMDKLSSEKVSTPANGARVVRMLSGRAAAVAAILAGVAVALVVLIDKPNNTDVFASISEEEAYSYVYENIDEFTSEDILVMAGESAFSDNYSDLTGEEVNIALEELLNDMDPDELDELF